MQIFVTGASGWVGSAVSRHLIAGGHSVTGLVRSDASAQKVVSLGATALHGDITFPDGFVEAAKAADAVIHCGYNHDFSDIPGAAATDKRVIEALGDALAGSGKPLIITAGTSGLGEDETQTLEQIAAYPRASEMTGMAQVARNVKAMIMRLPPSVHGDGDKGFMAVLIGFARRNGVAYYVGDGSTLWPAVHIEDAAAAYVLVLEKGVAGGRYNAVGEAGIPFRDIARVIGDKLSVPVESVSVENAAEKLGFLAHFAGLDLRASSVITRERLGWAPTRRGLIEDLRDGTYFD